MILARALRLGTRLLLRRPLERQAIGRFRRFGDRCLTAQLAEALFGAPAICATGVAHEFPTLIVLLHAVDAAIHIAPRADEFRHHPAYAKRKGGPRHIDL
jgi:hypothetical protein